MEKIIKILNIEFVSIDGKRKKISSKVDAEMFSKFNWNWIINEGCALWVPNLSIKFAQFYNIPSCFLILMGIKAQKEKSISFTSLTSAQVNVIPFWSSQFMIFPKFKADSTHVCRNMLPNRMGKLSGVGPKYSLTESNDLDDMENGMTAFISTTTSYSSSYGMWMYVRVGMNQWRYSPQGLGVRRTFLPYLLYFCFCPSAMQILRTCDTKPQTMARIEVKQ